MAEIKTDVCVISYNRLPYLQKCIWSILATKPRNCRLIVGDDCSTDGSVEWLQYMEKRGSIDKVLLSEKNEGTFANHNRTIRSSETEWVSFILSDFWVHRGWHEAATETIKKFDNCGMVSFYNNTRLNIDEHELIDENTYRVLRTGMGATIINRELFDTVGGFQLLPDGIKWGYKATPFCYACNKTNLKRNVHYQIIPFYAYGMDVITSPLNEIEETTEYREERHFHKYHRTLSERRKGEYQDE